MDWILFFVQLLSMFLHLNPRLSLASEFPERECCDSAPPPPPHYNTVTATAVTTTPKPPVNEKSDNMADKPLNCLEAKKFCDDDPQCSAVLKGIPLLCGPELVACSTVTVARCQAALRTLVSFSWFKPTCLCKEPKIEPICNSFRDLLFDHPCVFVHRKEVDMHPLPLIPTCEVAADICTNNSFCRQRLEEFSHTCTVANEKCSTLDRESCVQSWLRVRETPLLGCTCPNVSDHECQSLQSLVNKNPCVGSSFMQRAAAMTNAGVSFGSSLVRPLPLSPVQLPSLSPAAMLVACSPYPVSETSSTSGGHTFHSHFPCNVKAMIYDDLQADPKESMRQIKHVVGTCESALQACQNHKGCKSHLENVAQSCRITYCHPRSCRDAVRSLYEYLIVDDGNLALRIGLCICRRTGGRSDTDCVNAQGYLHPECAERSDFRSISQCHRLGRECRNNKTCRYRLEYYEQACAADTLTGRCAGNHQECRRAAMGLFGSPLHINCVCKGDAFSKPSKCLSWKRLLWGNPCVVESQLTYFLTQVGPNINIPAPEDDYGHYKMPPLYDTIFGGDISSVETLFTNQLENYDGGSSENTAETDDFATKLDVIKTVYKPFTANNGGKDDVMTYDFQDSNSESSHLSRKLDSPALTSSSNYPSEGGPRGHLGGGHFIDRGGGVVPPFVEEVTGLPSTSSTWKVPFFNTYSTIQPTTTLPAKYCKVAREWDSHSPRIIESEDSIRIYKNANMDCSEICECTANEETFCTVVDCTENVPCETSYAVYNHKAPAYQAQRGECICYSGDFICMRPRSDEYSLEPGLFLLLGFSHKEEDSLKSITKGGAVDAIMPLQMLIKKLSSEIGYDCRLELTRNTSDNLILRVLSVPSPNAFIFNMSQEDRDRCKHVTERLAYMINNRHFDIHHHIQLSLFIMAEVLDNTPSAQLSASSATVISTQHLSSIILNCLLTFYCLSTVILKANS